MALLDTLSAIKESSIAPKNRVDILLAKWEGTEDGETLLAALHNADVSSAVITRALRQECHARDVVTDSSVDAWRRKNSPTELLGN